MASTEISLVQKTLLFSSMEIFLYDTFESAIVGICLAEKSSLFRLFYSYSNKRKGHSISPLFGFGNAK